MVSHVVEREDKENVDPNDEQNQDEQHPPLQKELREEPLPPAKKPAGRKTKSKDVEPELPTRQSTRKRKAAEDLEAEVIMKGRKFRKNLFALGFYVLFYQE